ncbi:MAG: hypothetical protein GYB55_23545 [Cytophagales bacterium]|uniref:hypothetical protein n=1 Tax=Cyclobacterium marinum TaxID=104 RepID=UPI0011EDC54D|nr:hypothetical protein [Cyclobacterium marinum]MBI0398467.1 hypothetical protein [Cyclobacterium marinum]MBR9777835.1 hypothetical protein [Cytophagales bacterium]|tara:strand:+ start:10717 stop:11346 length:630 start_codon:yes stop_codon:yes gene_type:complete
MQAKLDTQFSFPSELITSYQEIPLPEGFNLNLGIESDNKGLQINANPVLYTAHLPRILDWLHGLDQPSPLEKEPCDIPVLLFDKELSFDRLLFHYDGTPASTKIIKHFLHLFSENLRDSKATIISPAFIPKSKLKEEQEIIQDVANYTAETSFIKFNFNRIGDFWSYAVKHQKTLLVTTKNNQSDLAKVLFHFYKGGLWYDKLSFYLAL